MQKRIMAILAGAAMLWSGAVRADGIIVPPPGVDISVKYHRVTVEIRDQIARTTIDQVFLNDSEIDSVEGMYVFPLPKEANFANFTMFVDGKELAAEVLEADSARAIYESIVRRRKDPALLEYLDRGLFRARVYPIRAGGEKRITISYTELLPYDAGIYRYLYPLSTEKFSARPLEDVSITIALSSTNPIKTIYSPSHPIVVQKTDDFNAEIVYAEENVKPAQDFLLYYTVSPDDIGLHLLAYNTAEDDGFYLLMAAPKLEIEQSQIAKKRLLFVLDRSGSMAGEKLEQAKAALRFSVTNLNSDDVFNIIAFSTSLLQFKTAPVQATAENRTAALQFIDRFAASGGTNINDALLAALGEMQSDEFENMLIFLTDGLPTVGERDIEQIRQNVKTANVADARLFVFGVGYDVNTHLLDYLADDNHGVSTYVRPDENLEIAVSSFFEKINNPVLANLSLDYGGMQTYESFPEQLPDLFKGSQLTVLGRYAGSGAAVVTLAGEVNGVQQSFTHEVDFPAENAAHDFLPRLWATRKVGFLLNQIRLYGESEELIQEIIALSKRYGIITPYTSFLILEDTPSGDAFADFANQTGESAVNAAANTRNYRDADNTKSVTSRALRYAGSKTFFMRDSFWVDATFSGTETLIDVEFASDAYFQLLRDQPSLGLYFAVGKNLIVSFGDVAYKVHETGKDYTHVEELPQTYVLLQNTPNPFPTARTAGTRIRYFLGEPAQVQVAIYDILGRQIVILHKGFHAAGLHAIPWDGRDASGREMPSGVYLYKLTAGSTVQVKKMLKVR